MFLTSFEVRVYPESTVKAHVQYHMTFGYKGNFVQQYQEKNYHSNLQKTACAIRKKVHFASSFEMLDHRLTRTGN